MIIQINLYSDDVGKKRQKDEIIKDNLRISDLILKVASEEKINNPNKKYFPISYSLANELFGYVIK